MISRPGRAPLGASGEDLVADELRARGYDILARNVEVGGVELDIVARRGRRVLVIEVKTGRSTEPEHNLGDRQRSRLLRACRRLQRQFRPPPSALELGLAAVRVTDTGFELRFFRVSADGAGDVI